jgi:predicted DNA-binding transcriptional regulator YafY
LELDTFSRQLHLIELLTGNSTLTINQLCERLQLSRRTIYRYLQLFQQVGFEVYRNGSIYSIGANSPFYNIISDRLRLSPNDISALAALLRQADVSQPSVMRLQQKMHNYYGIDCSQKEINVHRDLVEKTETLRQAIQQKRQVILHDYYSPHRKNTTNRLVEPFLLLPYTNDVRCYELESGTCKTFKISRIEGKVEILNTHWQSPTKHIHFYTDIFGFSSETTHRITLRLSSLAMRLLIEEYGVQETQMMIDSDDVHRIISLQVCSYQGIGRFVLGLLGEVEVLKGDDFKSYLRKQITKL